MTTKYFCSYYISREVWPENDVFGAMSAAPEDELLLMREIFMHNITTGKFLNIFFNFAKFHRNLSTAKIYKYFNSYRDIFFMHEKGLKSFN